MGIHSRLLANPCAPTQSARYAQQSRGQQHDKDAGEDTQHQRKYDLDLGLGRLLLSPLPPLRSYVFGEPAQRTDDRSTEPVRLRKQAHKGSKLLNLRPFGQDLLGFQSRPAASTMHV